MYILYLLLLSSYVYGDNFTSLSMFDTITHNFQLPHEKMGIIMHKHINNHTINSNNTIINQDERYLSNSQINMIEMHLCGFESSNTMRSYVFSVRVNYCFKCSITSSALADINSCKYNVVNISPNNFIWDFHTYTDTSCSAGDINQASYVEVLNECNLGGKVIYTPNFQLDITIPGMMTVEYSDTSCSTPFAFQITGIVKDICMQITYGSIKTIDCTNNNLQTQTYPTTDCSGNTYVEQSEPADSCYVDNSADIWYDYISFGAVIVYSDEHLRSGRFCSSLYSPIINTNPTPYPTVGSVTNDDWLNIDKGSCDTCPVYHMWEVKCGTFGTANTDIMCSETEDQFTCCSSTGDDCCVANGGTITVLILGIIMTIGACAYKCCGCPTKQQIANITNSNSSVLDTKIRLTDRSKGLSTDRSKGLSTDSNNLSIKALPFKEQKYTLSNMEEGIPLAEATIVPVEKPKKKKSNQKR
jgi:hypothetical protein